MLEIRSQYRPEKQRIDIYMFDPERQSAFVFNPNGIDDMTPYRPDTELPIYLSLPESAAYAIQKALEGELWKMPVPATAHHLEDAISVRDRMITLVELLTERASNVPKIIDFSKKGSHETSQ